ncbi:hypothetical protein [Paracoccus marinaquae]|uniref:Uncharacterized protein n=1 Tax=Paracoccus marinaquae TaxID=2841926 RepID=A0ABS6APQ8_9RHOB|nr:hypothetical protein [Paracoccus marinaquae]MBU3031837.1 hypothetical protein [Paracoccus marinaquae]
MFRRGLPVALCLSAFGAQAQSVAGEGPFTANFVGLAEADIPPLQIGPGRFAGLSNSVMTAMGVENAAFLHNQTGRCLGDWFVDEVAATYEQHVHCTYTDADGDQIFERADFDTQPLDGPRVGTGRWLGGTGKYEGISGVFEIRVQGLRSAREGLVQYLGTKQGNYHLPDKAAP